MNKKLFLKLGLGVGVVATISSAALISYGQKNNSTKEIEVSKSDTDSLDSNTQDLVAEDRGSVSSSTNLKDSKFEKTQENTQEKTQQKAQGKTQQSVQQNTQQNIQENTQQNVQQNIQQNIQENTQQNVQQNTQQNVQENTQQNVQENTQQEELEKEYYILIKEAWQRQKDYIDSIEDPWIKQSVQTPDAAACAKSVELSLKYPENTEIINRSLEKFVDERRV